MGNPNIEYITSEDLEKRVGAKAFVQLADDDGDGTADPDVISEIRLGALGEVNSYLGVRYETPIDTDVHTKLVGLLKSISLDMAEFRLRLRRPPVPEEVTARRNVTLKWLRDVAASRVSLPSITQLATNRTHGPIAKVLGVPRVLSRDSLDGF